MNLLSFSLLEFLLFLEVAMGEFGVKLVINTAQSISTIALCVFSDCLHSLWKNMNIFIPKALFVGMSMNTYLS